VAQKQTTGRDRLGHLAPTCEQPTTVEWAISRCAGLYQIRYEGVVANAAAAHVALAHV